MRTRLLLILLATLIAGAGGAQSGSREAAREAAQRKRIAQFAKGIGSGYNGTWRAASQLEVGQPVPDTHAWLLANAYFYAHVSGCGAIDLPVDKGTYWIVRTRLGIAATQGPDIRVDKATGATSSKGRPLVRDPKSYAKLLKPKPSAA